MRWWERITESPTFKRLDDPKTKVGHVAVTATALALGALALAQNPSTKADCAANPLRGVYNPHRLAVVGTCRTVVGTVVHSTKERDGDWHIQLEVADKSVLTPRNYSNQSGYLVVEYMPGDPWPRPANGEALRITGTLVHDVQHGGWAELHPVWAVTPLVSRVQP